MSLCAEKIMLPAMHGLGRFIILTITAPRTRHRGARRQHVRVDDSRAVSFIEMIASTLMRGESLFPGSANTFRTRRARLAQTAAGKAKTISPSSFRPGGATWLSQTSGENLQRTMWRGRWQDLKMLNHYVQELQTINVMSHMDKAATARIEGLAACYEGLLRDP